MQSDPGGPVRLRGPEEETGLAGEVLGEAEENRAVPEPPADARSLAEASGAEGQVSVEGDGSICERCQTEGARRSVLQSERQVEQIASTAGEARVLSLLCHV
jgi:hypothetical protein